MNTINNINFRGERVIIRVDYNVPFDEKNQIYLIKLLFQQILIN